MQADAAPRIAGRSRQAPDAAPASRQPIIDLLQGASVEISARDPAAVDSCLALLEPGSAVYVNFAAADTHHGLVATAKRLQRAGFLPVPHVAARYLAGYTQLGDYLSRASGEAGVEQVLVIAGDIDRPVGPFASSLQILETGLFAKHGIRRIGIAGYPEGHPKIAAADLDRALEAKLGCLQQGGSEPYIVTQFCLEAAPIINWIGKWRRHGVAVPIRVGLAGPTSIAALARYAVRCGIGNSIRALVGRQTSLARLLVEAGPEPVIAALAMARSPAEGVAGLHFFPFGGLQRTGNWMRAIMQGKFTLAPGADGFQVTG